VTTNAGKVFRILGAATGNAQQPIWLTVGQMTWLIHRSDSLSGNTLVRWTVLLMTSHVLGKQRYSKRPVSYLLIYLLLCVPDASGVYSKAKHW